MRSVLLLCILLSTVVTRSFAQFPNLDEGYPVQLEDAEPIPYGILQGQGYYRYSSYNDGTYGNRMVAGLEIGFAPNFQASLSASDAWGTLLQSLGSPLIVTALYNFLPESERLPAMSVEGLLDMAMPFVPQNSDLRIKYIASRTLDQDLGLRAHLNLTYGLLTQPGINERYYRFLGALGVSRSVSNDVMVVVDYSYEEERVARITDNLIEAGIRAGVSDSVTLCGSFGAGIGGESLLYRFSGGIQVWICDLVCPPGQKRKVR